VKGVVASLDPDQPIENVMLMNQLLNLTTGDYQFFMKLFGTFASFAVVLAVMGIYGVMSYYVNQRTREIGIRVALGAKSGDVLGLVVRLALKLSLIGVVVGVALALAGTRLLSTFLYDVKPSDPLTYGAVAATLVTVALLASYIPARRATKVDPMTALRYE
jgi:putative ABC transport system permease protein